MTEPRYTTLDDLDNESSQSSPQVPRAASFAAPPRNRDSRASLTPSIFSSAQSYSPLVHDQSGDGILRSSPSRPFLSSTQSTYSSRPMSRASSHMLGTDYDSVYQLAGYGDKEAIPMHGYNDKEDRSSMLSPQLHDADPKDYRSAGIAKYGLAADQKKKKMSPVKKWIIFGGLVVLAIIIAVAVAVPLLALHKSANDTSSPSGGATDGKTLVTAGGNGTVIQMANGSSFTYINNFGGQWRSGLTDNSAQAQSYTPPLNESWDYTKDRILGVNLGGWLVLEPFIVPSLFETYENTTNYVVDEYTLMQQWVKEGGVELATKNLQQHYDTFITEYDFAQIAGAGLNWVRIPIGYWAITTMPNEPFIEGLAWNYLLKAIQWARKYGLRIELDLHAVPGSQNGYNHGGRLGVFNFLNSPAGLVSADRTLDIIRTITEFITQPTVANVIPAFGVLNEPNIPVGIGLTAIQSFYAEAYNTVRNVTGLGQGKGPMMFLHDGFMGLNPSYSGFLQGGDRVGWDLHPYVCFVPPFNGREVLPVSACNGFLANTDQAFQQFGVTIAGEFSLAPNDCGLFLNGPFQGVRYDGSFSSGQFQSEGSCVPFDDWQNYNATTKQQMHDGAVAQMTAFQNFFFWTWKIGNSLRTGGPVNPNWSYLLGLQQGWMPTDPNSHLANGCAALQANYTSITKTSLDWQSTFADYQTGGASTYSPSTAKYSYPPASIASSGSSGSLTASLLPTYTPTGAHLTPNAAAPTAPTATVKNEPIPTYNAWPPGAAYTAGSYVAIAGCNYFSDIWQNVTSIPDGWPCSGSAAQKRDYSNIFKKRQPSPAPTPMPLLRR